MKDIRLAWDATQGDQGDEVCSAIHGIQAAACNIFVATDMGFPDDAEAPEDVEDRMRKVYDGVGDLFDLEMGPDNQHFDLTEPDARVLLKEMKRMLGWLSNTKESGQVRRKDIEVAIGFLAQNGIT